MADNNKLWILLIPVAGIGLYLLLKRSGGAGEVTLTLNSSVGGHTQPEAGKYKYEKGASVVLYAWPAAGYKFDHWSGDIGDANPLQSVLQFTMDSDKTVTANFSQITTPVPVHISVAATIGGTTNPVPGTYEYEEGQEISLLAIPDSGYKFFGWTGGSRGGLECTPDYSKSAITCVLAATDDGKTMTAVFTPIQQNGVQLNAGNNGFFLYTGTSGSIAFVMGQNVMSVLTRIWDYRNGQMLMYDPNDPIDSKLDYIYNGDYVGVVVTQAVFWTWR
jgi:hypothetical protein